jgi:hypothetical protein
MFDAPTLYTPGDNEWTDCHRASAGGFDPQERLNYIRSLYFADPSLSFGSKPETIAHQASDGYPENARILYQDVLFVTAHVVGSNNNLEARDLGATKEFFERDFANIEWLRSSFDVATKNSAEAMVVAIHANMFEFGFGPSWNAETWFPHSGFVNFGTVLREEAAAFERPVLLVYGDSHVFRQSRPFPTLAPNIMALEVPGAVQMHAVEVGVDIDLPGVFTVNLLRNPALEK